MVEQSATLCIHSQKGLCPHILQIFRKLFKITGFRGCAEIIGGDLEVRHRSAVQLDPDTRNFRDKLVPLVRRSEFVPDTSH